MWNVRLDEAQTGIKIAGRNINNLGYADGTTLMAESEEGAKQPPDESEKWDEKVGLIFNTQNMKILASGPIISVNRWGYNGNSDRLYFLGLQNHCRWWLQPWN